MSSGRSSNITPEDMADKLYARLGGDGCRWLSDSLFEGFDAPESGQQGQVVADFQ